MASVKHVQLFDVARTAHFERILRDGSETTILFRERRYDFDPELAQRVGAMRAGAIRSFWFAVTHDIEVLEIAEPFVVKAAPRSSAVILGVRLRGVLRSKRTRVVTYAIENRDPAGGASGLPLHARLRHRLRALWVPFVWRALDRVAFGTSQAEQLYERNLGRASGATRLIPALPISEICEEEKERRPPTMVFVGEFSERKGFPQLLHAWPMIKRAVPSATLVLIGKGPLVADAQELAALNDGVRVLVDPPRSRIFEILRGSKVLALPSQPRARWREQVGLPIVEALGQGCIIVTTTETGLAQWLTDNGHFVYEDAADIGALSSASIEALLSDMTVAEVVSALPQEDGRAAAQAWLLGSERV